MGVPRHALLIFSYFFKTQKRPFKVPKHFQPFSKLCTTPVKKRRQGGLLLNYNTSLPAAAQCSGPGRELPCLQQCRAVQGQVTPGLNCWKEKPTTVQVMRMGGEQCTPFIKVTTTISTKRIYVVIYLHEGRYLPGSNHLEPTPFLSVLIPSASSLKSSFSFYIYKILSGCTFHGVYVPCVYSR